MEMPSGCVACRSCSSGSWAGPDDRRAAAGNGCPARKCPTRSRALHRHRHRRVARVPAYAAAVQSDHAAPDEFALQTKAEHLRLAAAHLEAAGLKEEAQRVRQRAAKEPSHTTVAARQPILVELRMLELPWTKLDKLSSERYGGSKGMSVMELLSKLQSACADPRSPTFSASLDPNKLLSLIEALCKDHLVEPLAEPSLVVVPGRSASVFLWEVSLVTPGRIPRERKSPCSRSMAHVLTWCAPRIRRSDPP